MTLDYVYYEKRLSYSEKVKFRREINPLMCRNSIKRVTEIEQEFLSSIFLRKKKDNGRILIFNLKNLNKHVVYRYFTMDTLITTLGFEGKVCIMASIDLTDGYY